MEENSNKVLFTLSEHKHLEWIQREDEGGVRKFKQGSKVVSVLRNTQHYGEGTASSLDPNVTF